MCWTRTHGDLLPFPATLSWLVKTKLNLYIDFYQIRSIESFQSKHNFIHFIVYYFKNCVNSTVFSQLPVDGGWTEWSDWSTCSATCGQGTRERRRTCTSPAPSHGGAKCSGCDRERETCRSWPCPEVRRFSSWTPWLKSEGQLLGGASLERRYRVECAAEVDGAEKLRVGKPDVEERRCTPDGRCSGALSRPSNYGSKSGWSEWSEWSACDEPCGGGNQRRRRTCKSSACAGSPTEERTCNRHACRGKKA